MQPAVTFYLSLLFHKTPESEQIPSGQLQEALKDCSKEHTLNQSQLRLGPKTLLEFLRTPQDPSPYYY